MNSEKKGKQRRRTTKGKGRRPTERETMERDQVNRREAASNDVSWYSRNPQLLVAAGQIPYPYRPGMLMPYWEADPAPTTATKQSYAIPGIMSLSWVPSFGNSNSTTDPISVVGKEIYARVRAAYSGQLDADAPDYVVYIGALDGVFTYLAWLKRVYRTVSLYTPENYLFPDQMLAAYGFTNARVRQQLTTQKTLLWQLINELILMSRKYRCPAVMDLFNRHYWMSDNVYSDAPSPRAQLYVYNPGAVFKVTEVPVSGGTDMVQGLRLTAIPHTAAANSTIVETLYNYGLGLIQALDAWDDAYTISGYLMRAYDGVPSFTVAELEQNEMLTSAYEPEVLAQIENFRSVEAYGVSGSNTLTALIDSMVVTQRLSDNAVVCNASYTLSNYAQKVLVDQNVAVKDLINVHTDAPTVADTVIATRMHAVTRFSMSGTTLNAVIEAGTEIPYGMAVHTYSFTDVKVASDVSMPQYIFANYPTTGSGDFGMYSSGDVVLALQLDQFDWHPFVYVFSGNALNIRSGIVGDIYNVTKVAKDVLENIHKVCLYSEFNSFGL